MPGNLPEPAKPLRRAVALNRLHESSKASLRQQDKANDAQSDDRITAL